MTDYEQKIAAFMDAYADEAARAYIREIADRAAPLAKGEEALLMSAITAGDESARERLMEGHLLLVVSIAKGYLGRGLCALDLLQEGNAALMQAAATYDPACGRRFSLYAGDRIRHAILRAFSEAVIETRIPAEKLEAIGKTVSAYRALERTLGRAPTAEEIAAQLGVSPDEAESLNEQALSHNRQMLPDPDTVLALLQNSLTELTPREQKVIELRAGLNGCSRHTIEEVAAQFGVTPNRILQIEAKALRKAGIYKLARAERIRRFIEETE